MFRGVSRHVYSCLASSIDSDRTIFSCSHSHLLAYLAGAKPTAFLPRS